MAKENTGDGRGGIDTMPCTKRRTVQPPHSTRRLPTLAMLTRPTAAPAFLPPLLLQTFAYGVKHAEVPERRTAEASTCAGRVYQQVWIVQQYANHGTLADAIECGWLRHRDGPQAGQPNMPHILKTTLEVASALAYLHSHGIVHGDLSGSNVFLVGMTQRQPGSRPFVAKVGDFGLSRLMDHGQLTTSTCGTVTNMPLELISRGLPTSAMDVFSFGVLCHEMLTGQRSLMQILFARTEARQQLHVPDHCPPGYRHLLESCLQEDHLHRPPFADIVKDVEELLQAEGDSSSHHGVAA